MGALLLLGACEGALPPLRGKMEVGRDAYAVFVGGTAHAGGDLYAVRTEGGPAVQVTFTPVGEMGPALSRDGRMLAFLRGGSLRDSTPGSVWILNLNTGGERQVDLPAAAGIPRRVAWAPDGTSLVVRTAAGLYRVPSPPAETEARPVPQAQRAEAESTLAVLLGDPPFGEAVPCPDPADLCLRTKTGASAPLAADSHDPTRWGPDSVAFFRSDGTLEIRPLGPGRARLLRVEGGPKRMREVTVFGGPR
ncbi:MAG TPA: hypothetical protein VFS28_02415 [Gemmatimonadales bacterium]|nr:hypothetical protein [Gemmatimonadales bacterium]